MTKPSEMAGREATKLAYGENNPYVRVPEYATVSAVTRQDLLDWHNNYIVSQQHIAGDRRRFRFRENGSCAAQSVRRLGQGARGNNAGNEV